MQWRTALGSISFTFTTRRAALFFWPNGKNRSSFTSVVCVKLTLDRATTVMVSEQVKVNKIYGLNIFQLLIH